ncbi:MAG: protein MobC [Desulfovibrio sp.]|uniref:protein MobC n=1 Tax=Desulfovibrio sp. TaxID=885 RepID=UPI001A76ED34|nr:protein MobC [Desulfovibrio sp.]MBD5417502.1 protein MobC [Desulfovibrio sp.]
MAITAEQAKSIRQELDQLRPASALSGNRELSIKQTIFALAPALERMKKRGFELPEIIAKLAEKGIEVKPQTLAKYLGEARRQKDARKTKRQASSPHCSAPKAACRNAGPLDADTPPVKTSKSSDQESSNVRDFPLPNNGDSSLGKSSPRYGTFKIIPDTPIGEL